MMEMGAEPEMSLVDKDKIIEALVYCIEMPEETETDCIEKWAYKRCLANLGIIRQKNS